MPGDDSADAPERRSRLATARLHAKLTAEHAFRGSARHRVTQLAASISYYGLLSLFPAAIFLTAVFGIFIGDGDAREEVIDYLFDQLPLAEGTGRSDLEVVVRGVTDSSRTAGAISLLATVISASALMSAIRNSINTVFETEERRPPLRGKAFDILLVLGLALVIGVSLVATVVGQLDITFGGPVGEAVESAASLITVLLPIALALLMFSVAFIVLPAGYRSLRDVWPGILVGAILYELVKRGFAVYLDGFSNYSDVYGSLGAVIAFLVFLYLASVAALFAAEVAAAWPGVRDGRITEGPPDERSLPERAADIAKGLVVDDDEDEREEREGSRPPGPSGTA